MKRLEQWILDRVASIVLFFAIATVALAGAAIYLFIAESGVEEKIGPDVQVVGPCRTYGPLAGECVKQSYLIFTSLCYQGIPDRGACNRLIGNDFYGSVESYVERGGVVPGDGSNPSGQPGPPSGGPSPNPPRPNPPEPPAPPAERPDVDLPGDLPDVTLPCVNALGVAVAC